MEALVIQGPLATMNLGHTLGLATFGRLKVSMRQNGRTSIMPLRSSDPISGSLR